VIALLAAAAAAPIQLYDLELDDGGFVATGDAGQWEWGVVVDDPGSGFDGARAWTTGRVSRYLNASTDYLEIPIPSLVGLSRPMLSIQHWYEVEPGDAAWVEADTGNGWSPIEPLYGYPVADGYVGASGGWRSAVFDLSGLGDEPGLRLVFATDLSGVAAGWTVDQVALHDGDVAAPRLADLTALTDTDDLVGPYVVDAYAVDDTAVAGVEVVWRADGVEGRAAMIDVGDDIWRGSIPAQPPDTEVAYWVEATDGLNASREPVDGDLAFRVRLPAPTGLTGPAGRVVDTHATLSWTAPVSRNPVEGYEVLRGDAVVASAAATTAEVALSGRDTFTVRAVYEAGPGDASDPFTVDAAVPAVFALAPAEGWPGDTLRVALSGEYLLLVAGEVAAELGAGVTVTAIDVRDVDAAWLDLTVADTAAQGPRTLGLTSGGVTVELPDAFTVLDPSERPRITTVVPDRLRQGDEGELSIGVVGGLAATPAVDLGEGVVVRSVRVEGEGVVVGYTVTGAAPLGVRPVTVDDGVRLLEGGTLEIRDGFAPSSRGCATPVAPAAALVLVALAAALGRRRA
jgi:hypothetical protein